MCQPETDKDLLEATWRLYDEEFAEHVGGVITPYEHVDTESHLDWGAQVFMFGYALGSIAGAHAIDPGNVSREMNQSRVTDTVDTVIDIAEADDIPVSSTSIKEDFLEDSS